MSQKKVRFVTGAGRADRDVLRSLARDHQPPADRPPAENER